MKLSRPEPKERCGIQFQDYKGTKVVKGSSRRVTIYDVPAKAMFDKFMKWLKTQDVMAKPPKDYKKKRKVKAKAKKGK